MTNNRLKKTEGVKTSVFYNVFVYGGLLLPDGKYVEAKDVFSHGQAMENNGFVSYSDFYEKGGIRICYPNEKQQSVGGIEFDSDVGITPHNMSILKKILNEIFLIYGKELWFSMEIVALKNKKSDLIYTDKLPKILNFLKRYEK